MKWSIIQFVNAPLPIDDLLPGIADALKAHPALVLTAPPGAGKTTRVPRALLDAGFAESGEIVILEPRRIAARLAAARVAEELAQQLGETVGYTIRYEKVDSRRTRLRFVTEAILTRRLIDDARLNDVSVVILDEFHERSLHADLALALLRRLQQQDRPDLKLLVMSATIEPAPVCRFLGDAPALAGAGFLHPVQIDFAARPPGRPLHEEAAAAVRQAIRAGLGGDILVFLPGAAEIRQTASCLQTLDGIKELEVVPLHGDLPLAAQVRAVRPAPRRKVILATNVAESSITIPGVGVVIDSGLAREAGHSVWNGLPRLSVARISKASAEQRAGRAGRTRAGHVFRLYTRHDFETRRAYDRPEIHRLDLSEAVLLLHGLEIRKVESLAWLDPPPQAATDAAEELLRRLGALDADGRLSAIGREMLRLPAHPRLARMIVAGKKLGVAGQACLAAAIMSERDMRLGARAELQPRTRSPGAPHSGKSDITELADLFEAARLCGFDAAELARLGLDARAVESVSRHSRHLAQIIGARSHQKRRAGDTDEAVGIALLAAFPDRVARLRRKGAPELLLATGGSARLSDSSVVREAPLLVALDIEERTGRRGSLQTEAVVVRLASALEPEWLAALFPDRLIEERELQWNEAAGRADEITRTLYGRLALEERTRPAPLSASTAEMLLQAALRRDLRDFADAGDCAVLQARLELIFRHFPKIAGGRGSHIIEAESAARAACAQKRSLDELKSVSLKEVILAGMDARLRSRLEREAPERVELPGGRRLKVHYEPGKPPWIEARLQEFFGMAKTPAICAGRLPLTVRLLAPNMRPVQVTQDLASFWKVHYPELRRRLQRRHPKHAWPESGE